MQIILLYIGALILSMACGFIFIPIITKYCVANGFFDMPSIRKVHKNPIPRLGGIAFVPSMLLATIIVLYVLNSHSSNGLNISLWSLFFCISLFIIYFTGIIDDVIGLNATVKFIVEIIATLIVPFSGLYINNLYGFLGFYVIPFSIGAPLTVLVMVFTCNAINLIDGIDGLAASLTIIALIGFIIGFHNDELYFYCVMIASLIGVLIPYLRYNLFGNTEKKEKIFMGDSGSLSLGYILGFLVVKFCMDSPKVDYNPDRILWAWTFLAVPYLDVLRVFFYRVCHHQSPFHPDKNHIHHKLIRTGFNQHQALTIILCLQLIIIAVNSLLYDTVPLPIIFLIDITVYSAVIISADIAINRKEMLVGKSRQVL